MGDGFRGVSSDQDGRFKSAEKKLFAKMKFPPQFSTKVDMRKVSACRARAPGCVRAARCRRRRGVARVPAVRQSDATRERAGAPRCAAPLGHQEGDDVRGLRGRHPHQHGDGRAGKGAARPTIARHIARPHGRSLLLPTAQDSPR